MCVGGSRQGVRVPLNMSIPETFFKKVGKTAFWIPCWFSKRFFKKWGKLLFEFHAGSAIENDYVVERPVTDGRTKWINIYDAR
jgi:hypothetical protein